MKRGAQLSMALCTNSSLAITFSLSDLWVSANQFFVHPICLLWAMLVRDVVADMVAILEQPQLSHPTRFCGNACALHGGYQPIALALNDQQRACDLLYNALQIKLPQLLYSLILILRI